MQFFSVVIITHVPSVQIVKLVYFQFSRVM